ncbi:Uroporphyrinogen III synthase HEM4 [Chloroherpeton thalassium ATCC 35110]|uniref:Uroporphyrinogen-III synthase n=1 Tax=Chloroherpeton thalassium (strain ATCC 35110 / GB-78) TaxID=517418 RepID=B3QWI2_CHLT3|nr:uroporphyrinogen-III synthase [Chloroherpeton thalassium]ACF14742.1 Uroporphyrinogen III synthase HEM4 [Chloroherpeton thalassium ATCC 35110]
MKTVLVTRPKDQAGSLIAALSKFNLGCELFPTIEIAAVPGWSLPGLSGYAGIFFTSVNSVNYLCTPLQKDFPEFAREINKLKVFAVGVKTAKALAKFNISTEELPSQAYATDLMAMIKPEEIQNNKFLFIRGTLSLGIIPAEISKHGGLCDEITVYENKIATPPPDELVRIKSLLEQGKIDCIVFTSPSTAINFFQLLNIQSLPEKTKVASIGTTTSGALTDMNIATDIMPDYSTSEGLAEAIANSLY